MSLMSMRRKMASSATIILWVLVVVFIIGIVMLSIPGRLPNPSDHGGFVPPNGNTVAVVDGHRISADTLNKLYEEQTKTAEPNVDSVLNLRQGIFDKVMGEELTKEALDALHLGGWGLDGRVREFANEYADMQLLQTKKTAADKFKKQQDDAAAAAKTAAAAPKPADATTPAPANAAASATNAATPPAAAKPADKPKTETEFLTSEMEDFVKQNGSQPGMTKLTNPTPEQFKHWIVNDFLMSKNGVYDRFKPFAEQDLIGKAVMSDLKPQRPDSDEIVKKMKTQDVYASFIFVKAAHANADELQKASARAMEVYNRIKAKPDTFALEARKNSGDTSAVRGGNLDWVSAGANSLPIVAEYQIFTTDKGMLSPVMLMSESDYHNATPSTGYGFVRVDKLRPTTSAAAKDFKATDADAMQLARLETGQRYAMSLGSSYISSLRVKANVQINTPELQAYYFDAMGDTVKADAARKAAMDDPKLPELVKAAFAAYLAPRTSNMADRAKYLERSLPFNSSGSSICVMHQQLGDTYAALKKTKEAIEQYHFAVETADENNLQIRQQVLLSLQHLGDTAYAKTLEDWLKTHAQAHPAPDGAPMRPTQPPQ